MSDEKLTLNDIAALIVQIEPTDLADWARVRRALNVIAQSSPTSAQRPIAEAIQKIERMAGGKASDPFDLLADIGALVEEAIDATEKSGEEETFLSGPKREQLPTNGPSAEPGRSNAFPPEADPALLVSSSLRARI
jgi:hypothetical protein